MLGDSSHGASGLYTALVLAIFAILTVVRHTRAEEDSQRAEMLASGVVGRYAMLAAAIGVVVGTMVIAALLIVAVLIGYGSRRVGICRLRRGRRCVWSGVRGRGGRHRPARVLLPGC